MSQWRFRFSQFEVFWGIVIIRFKDLRLSYFFISISFKLSPLCLSDFPAFLDDEGPVAQFKKKENSQKKYCAGKEERRAFYKQ